MLARRTRLRRATSRPRGRSDAPAAVLVTHINPPIHGQAQIAAELLRIASGWEHMRLVPFNAVYASSREALVGFSLRKMARALRYLVAVPVVIRRSRAQIVIITPAFYPGPFLKDALMILVLRAFTGARIIAWVHMDPQRLDLPSKPFWYRRFALQAIRHVDYWVACAQSLTETWPSFIPVSQRLAIHNGCPEPPARVPRSFEAGRLRVSYLSSLDESKGWVDFVAAAALICEDHPDTEFALWGDVGIGCTADDVARRLADTRCPTRVRWHGPASGEEKWKVLLASHLFCFPSRSEQFPLVVLEAMACGLPIVATRVGAVKDAVVDGEGGWLVEPGSPEKLAQAMNCALTDRQFLADFGCFNRRRHAEQFSIEHFGAAWETLVRSLLLTDASE